ncbi:MAG: hypothetical protein ACLFTT_00480 [Candidatus Hydrogenedentota bacterium]
MPYPPAHAKNKRDYSIALGYEDLTGHDDLLCDAHVARRSATPMCE